MNARQAADHLLAVATWLDQWPELDDIHYAGSHFRRGQTVADNDGAYIEIYWRRLAALPVWASRRPDEARVVQDNVHVLFVDGPVCISTCAGVDQAPEAWLAAVEVRPLCPSCARPFSAQEARAGFKTCEHCASKPDPAEPTAA